jgi:hypothetical protein
MMEGRGIEMAGWQCAGAVWPATLWLTRSYGGVMPADDARGGLFAWLEALRENLKPT